MEQQLEELEVLSSIFPDELEVTSTDPVCLKIHLLPTPDPANNHVVIDLICSLPASYPAEQRPTVDIEVVKGLGKKQTEELKGLIDRSAEENIGMPSIYSIVEVVREWLVDNNVPGQDGSMYAEMMRRMQQKDVEKKKMDEKVAIMRAADDENLKKISETPEELERIRKRQAGRPVTLDTFLAWKIKFEEEMRAAAGNAAVREESEQKLTGKQWFLLNANSSADLQQEDALIAAGEQEIESWAMQLLLQGAEEKEEGGDGGSSDSDFVPSEEEDDDEES